MISTSGDVGGEALADHVRRLLAGDLKKLKHRPRLFLTHLKPGSEEVIVQQCREHIDSLSVQRLCGGDRFTL